MSLVRGDGCSYRIGPMSTEMGQELAKRIGAVKHLECSCHFLTGINEVLHEAISIAMKKPILKSLKLKKKSLLKIAVLGDANVGKTCIIHTFTRNGQFDVFGDRLGRCSDPFHSFLSCVELDGEIFRLFFWNVSSPTEVTTCVESRTVMFPYDKGIDISMIVFSVSDPSSFSSVKNKWIPELKHDHPKVPIVLVGNKIDMREDAKHFITIEMGKQLASRINASCYIECSSFDDMKVENLFEETVWASLRHAEKRRRKKSWLFRFFNGKSKQDRLFPKNRGVDPFNVF